MSETERDRAVWQIGQYIRALALRGVTEDEAHELVRDVFQRDGSGPSPTEGQGWALQCPHGSVLAVPPGWQVSIRNCPHGSRAGFSAPDEDEWRWVDQ